MIVASLPCAALPSAEVDIVWARPTDCLQRPEWVPLVAAGWGTEHDRPMIWALIDWHGAPRLAHLLPAGKIATYTATKVTPRHVAGYTWHNWLLPPAHGCAEATPPTPDRINHMWTQYQPPAEEGQLSLIPLGQLQ